MTLYRNHLINILFATIAVLMCGCIKNGHNCTLTPVLNISFYSKSPCQDQAVYPEGIKDILLCVFDENDVLAYHRYNNNVSFSDAYTETVSLGSGLYTVTAWSGVADHTFDISGLENGRTLKSDLYFRLKRDGGEAARTAGTTIYSGESRAVFIPEDGKKDGAAVTASVNMLEVTNRFTVSVAGLVGDITDYGISIESDNGSMNLDGSIADDVIVKYQPTDLSLPDLLEAAFTTLLLETGQKNSIVITDKVNGRELYRGDLLGTLLLKNPGVDLKCDHDFTIRFTTEDQCDCGTYVITEIWVNNWLVHSYDMPLR